MTDATAPLTRRGAKLGAWALGITVFPLFYAAIGVVLALLGQGQNGNEVAVTIAYVMFFVGFVVIPVCFLAGLVFAILALALDRALGKILGGIAIAVLIAGVVVLVVFLTGSSSPLFWTDF